MADINDMIDSVLSKNPVDFNTALKDIMGQKTTEAIELARIETAQSIYGEVEDSDADTTDDDELDFDLDDLDLDDLDLDLDDEGLDDDFS